MKRLLDAVVLKGHDVEGNEWEEPVNLRMVEGQRHMLFIGVRESGAYSMRCGNVSLPLFGGIIRDVLRFCRTELTNWKYALKCPDGLYWWAYRYELDSAIREILN